MGTHRNFVLNRRRPFDESITLHLIRWTDPFVCFTQRSPRHSVHGRGAGTGRGVTPGQRQVRGQRVGRGGGQRRNGIGVGGQIAGPIVPVTVPGHHHQNAFGDDRPRE